MRDNDTSSAPQIAIELTQETINNLFSSDQGTIRFTTPMDVDNNNSNILSQFVPTYIKISLSSNLTTQSLIDIAAYISKNISSYEVMFSLFSKIICISTIDRSEHKLIQELLRTVNNLTPEALTARDISRETIVEIYSRVSHQSIERVVDNTGAYLQNTTCSNIATEKYNLITETKQNFYSMANYQDKRNYLLDLLAQCELQIVYSIYQENQEQTTELLCSLKPQLVFTFCSVCRPALFYTETDVSQQIFDLIFYNLDIDALFEIIKSIQQNVECQTINFI